VDCSLVFQYFYYTWRAKPSIPSASARRLSIGRGASRYRTISVVAANVAASAALAAQQGDQLDHRRRWQRHGEDRERVGSHAFEEHENDGEEEMLTAMTASFHSEGGRELAPKRVSWSTERHRRRGGSVGHLPGVSPSSRVPAPLPLTSTDSVIDLSGRGRTLEREVDGGLQIHSASREHRSSRSRRTTMVFLSAWALFGIGTVAGVRRGATGSQIGRVLAAKGIHMPTPIPIVGSYMQHDTSLFTHQWSERVVGRIFAWLCTTLYLTSRLPQIWKNVRPFLKFSMES
jgi:hypothetical protein